MGPSWFQAELTSFQKFTVVKVVCFLSEECHVDKVHLFCGCTGRFVSDLVRKPADLFSCVVAQIFFVQKYTNRCLLLSFFQMILIPEEKKNDSHLR